MSLLRINPPGQPVVLIEPRKRDGKTGFWVTYEPGVAVQMALAGFR